MPPTIQKIDIIEEKKRIFIMNALENGWSVKKRGGSYVFSKKHEGKKEILREGYLETFLSENANFGTLHKSR